MSRQWMRVDAAFFGSPLAVKLQDEFGWAGPALWLAFLAACKRSHPAGQMTFLGDTDALAQMGFSGRRLVDDDGKEWDLETFWRVLGRTKNVRRTSRGHVVNVRATHWEQWQEDERRADAAERQSRSRAKKQRDMDVTSPGHESQKSHAREEKRREEKTPPKPPPAGGAGMVAPLPTTGAAADVPAPAGEQLTLAATGAAAALRAAMPEPPPPPGRRQRNGAPPDDGPEEPGP